MAVRGGAQIVADRPQQVAPGAFLFVFGPQALLVTAAYCHGAGEDTHHKQRYKGDGIAGAGKAQLGKGLGKKVIDHKDRKQRAEQAPQVAIGKKAGEKYCQHKDDRCGILGVAHLPQIQADEQRTQVQKQHGDGILLPFGIGFIPLDR